MDGYTRSALVEISQCLSFHGAVYLNCGSLTCSHVAALLSGLNVGENETNLSP